MEHTTYASYRPFRLRTAADRRPRAPAAHGNDRNSTHAENYGCCRARILTDRGANTAARINRRRAAASEHTGQERKTETRAEPGPDCRARTSKEMRRRMEGREGRRKGRQKHDLSEILERVQQAPQGRRQIIFNM